MLVFTEWLKENNLYTRYFNNVHKTDIDRVKEASPEHWVGGAFTWVCTREGSDFWMDANVKWEAEANKASEVVFEPMKENIVTYQDLIIKEYILQEGDRIENIHGFTEYQVIKNKRWFLLNNNVKGNNDDIYEYLKAGKPNNLGVCPEFETAEDLTKEVIRLFKLSPYKLGDSVVIKQISIETPCPFRVTPVMSSYAGKTAQITEIGNIETYDLLNPAYNGDFHKYHLDVNSDYIWTSNLFDKVTSTNPKQDQQSLISPADTKETIQITITKKRKFNITL